MSAHSRVSAEAGQRKKTRSQPELRESEERLRAILNTAVEGIITIDERGTIESLNPAAERIFGYTPEELIGKNVNVLMPSPYHEEHDRYLANYLRTGHAKIIGIGREVSGLRKDGSIFPMDLSVSEVRLPNRLLFTGFVRDVTERKEAEQALRIRAQQQSAVAEISQHALEGRDLNTLLDDAVALVPQILGVEFCKIAEFRAAGEDLPIVAGAGWKEGFIGQAGVPSGHGSQSAFTLLANQPVISEDYRTETRFTPPEFLRESGVRSGVTVIIHGRGKPYGVLGAHSTKPRKFTGDDVHFLQSVANVLAAAIERRQLEEELLGTIQREQRRIGQDLHDGLCQHLVGTEFRMRTLVRKLAGKPKLQTETSEIAQFIRDGVRQARMLARGLVPVELETNGLMSALHELTANTEKLFEITCRFECAQPVLIADHMTATHLYHIAQESINNAVKHGKACCVRVALTDKKGYITLSITDDGVSFDPKKLRDSHGMGLRIMEYRAEMIGASLRFGPREGNKGSAVICALENKS